MARITLFLCILIALPLQTEALTRSQAVAIALENSPVIKSSAASATAAGAVSMQSFWLDNPVVELDWAGLPTFGSLKSFESRELTVEQTIPNPIRRYFDIAGKNAEKDVAYLEYQWVRREIEAQVQVQYTRWSVARRRVVMRQADLQDARTLSDVAAKRLEQGTIDRFTSLQAEVEVRQAMTTLRGAESEEEMARQDLSLLLGQAITSEPDDSLSLPPEVPVPDSTGRYLLAERGVDAAENQRNGTLTSLLPDFALAGYQTRGMAGETSWGFRIAATVPLWVFPNWTSEVRIANANLDRAHAEAERIRQDYRARRQTLETQWRKYQDDLHDHRSGIMATADELLRVAQKSYSEGAVDYLHLLEARRSHRAVMEGYHDLIQNLWSTWAQLYMFRPEETK